MSGAADSGLSQRYIDTDGGLLSLIQIFLVRLPINVGSWMVMADIPTLLHVGSGCCVEKNDSLVISRGFNHD